MSGQRTGFAKTGVMTLLAGVVLAGALLASAAPARAAMAKIRFVYDWPSADFLLTPVAVAEARGYYKAQGITTAVAFPPNTETTARVLASGAADIGFEGSTDIAFAAAHGLPIISIAAFTQGNNWCLVGRPGEKIDLHHLAGKSIGVFADSWTKAMMPFVLKAAGLKASQIHQVIATDDDITLLLSGKIDIATNTANYAVPEVVGAVHKQPTLVCAPAFGAPDVPVWVFTGRTGWLKSHPDLARKWLAATEKGMGWSVAHPRQAVRILAKLYPQTGDVSYSLIGWQETVPLLKGRQGFMMQDAAQWTGLATALKNTGQIPDVLPASAYFTNAYLKPWRAR